MSGYTNRGGSPFALNLTATTLGVIQTAGVAASVQAAGAPIAMPGPTTRVRVTAAVQAVRVYFAQADFDADQHYVPVAVGTPVDMPWEVRQLWLRGQTGTSTVDIMGVLKT